MRKTKILLFVGATAIALIIFAAACKKSTTTATEDTGYANEQALADKTYNDVSSIADQASTMSAGSMNYRTTGTTLGGCATITRDTVAIPHTLTIDFGSTDCLCFDGRTRRGQIVISYSGHYADSGSTHTITFNNYYQDDNKVTGTKTVTSMGHNASGQPYFDVTINGTITFASGGTISANWSRVRTWTAGSNTPHDFTDDVYTISGTGALTRANGTQVNVNIPTATPLVVAHNCKWIEAGTITFTIVSTGATRSLNYGDTPACDNMAVVTLANGTTRTIALP